MRPRGVVVAAPCAKDVVELGTTEADEGIQAFALDGADGGFGKGVCVWRSMSDLDNPRDFRRPDRIEAGAEFGLRSALLHKW